jgi:FkbM family methyltransferase
MKKVLKEVANALIRPAGARVVKENWGPRGCFETFKHALRLGFVPQTVIDIGASDGRWSEMCMKVYPQARYALFDALPAHAQALQAFAARHSNAQVRSVGLGATHGNMVLHVHGHQSSMLSSQEFQGQDVTVEVRTLDSFMPEMQLQGPILLKADVQGYELTILQGAKQILQMTDLAVLEVSYHQVYDNAPLAHDVITAMADAGFRIFDICSYDQRPLDGSLAQSDIAFAKSGSALFKSELWG